MLMLIRLYITLISITLIVIVMAPMLWLFGVKTPYSVLPAIFKSWVFNVDEA
jgi:hypothetical protein